MVIFFIAIPALCFALVGQDGILRTDCQSVQPGAARPAFAEYQRAFLKQCA
jgi:hypothetical protein